MEKTLICCFHGFLGQPSDYDFLTNQLKLENEIEWMIPDLFKWGEQYDWPHLNHFGKTFHQFLSQHADSAKVKFNKKIFIGYSMGGRLGLHLLKYQMELLSKNKDFCFDQFIFISTGTGLIKEKDKILRIQDDKKWAQIFLEKSWSEALQLWNDQGVLQNSQEPNRLEKNYNKLNLGKSFESWGLAQQQNMVEIINQSEEKMLWLVGEKDLKYQGIYSYLKEKTHLKKKLVPHSGHRIIFDAQLTVLQTIRDCIEELKKGK